MQDRKRVSPCAAAGLLVVLAACAAGGLGGAPSPRDIEKSVTPESEHYLGRAVAATILGHYRTFDDQDVLLYLNLVGRLLARASERPDTFGGYHFQVLDSDEINAFAAPGGLIFVTRGLLRCCSSEDAVAGVLAHEIAHVQYRHALQTLRHNRLAQGFRKSRMTSTLTTAGVPMAGRVGSAELIQLTASLESSIGDVTDILVRSGYSRRFEQEADLAAVEIMQRVGYDPRALVEVLQAMGQRLGYDRRGFAATHPSSSKRADTVSPHVASVVPWPASPERARRFERATARI